MRIKASHLFSLIFLFICSCKKSSTDTNSFSTASFPNQVGDSWLYLVNDTTVNGPDSTASQYEMTISITDSVQLPTGGKATVWVYKYPGGSDTNYVYQTGDTIRFLDRFKLSIARQYIIPLVIDHNWPYVLPGIHDVIINDQSDIMVGTTVFKNAFHLSGDAGMPDGSFGIDEWLENNVGVIKRYYNPFGELINLRHVTAWTLISFHLR